MKHSLSLTPLISLFVAGADWSSQSNAELLTRRWQTLFAELNQQLPHGVITRLITGYRAGAEQLAVALAAENRFDIHLLLAHKFNDTPGLVEAEKNFSIQRIVSLGRADDEMLLEPDPFAMRNQLALNFTDLLVCYCDHQSRDREHLVTLDLMRQAALSRKPVIWLNAQGELNWLNLTALTDAALMIISASDYSAETLLDCFQPIKQLHDTPLTPYLQQLLNPRRQRDDPNAQCLASLNQDIQQPDAFELCWVNRILHRLGHDRLLSEFKHWWQNLHQDIQPRQPLIEAFNQHHELANKAGGLHRSNVWLLYGFSALAVLVAVTSEVWQIHWLAFVELALITSIIYRVWWARKAKLHEKWIRHRFLAEQLRYCIMGYPILAIPKPFRLPVWQIKDNGKLHLISAELWLLQRHLITTGLPCENHQVYTPPYHNLDLAKHILGGVESQMHYHQTHHHQKHSGHHRLHWIAELSFLATFIAVVVHINLHADWLLLFTAALPAFAAAIHGILTKLEMERVSGQSAHIYLQLKQLDQALTQFIAQAKPGDDNWHQWVSLFYLADLSQQTMSDNITQWQQLIQHQQTEIPA